MKNNEFKQFLTQAKLPTPLQRQRLQAELNEPVSVPTSKLPAKVKEREQRLNETRVCVYCGASGALKHGKSSDLVRFRCRAEACGKTWTALTGTKLAGLRKRDKWETYEQCLRDRLTLAESAKRCEINVKTAFKWRHRMVSEARPTPELAGVVEIDETYFHESEKGKRDLIEHRKPRKRGGNPDGDAIQRPVMTTVARGGEAVAWETYDMTSTPVQVMMKATTAQDCVVVTDSHLTYRSVARRLKRTRQALNLSKGERSRGSWHLNTVNNRHSVMKSKLNHYHRGVSTKYLDNYMNWLARQEFRPDKYAEPNFIGDHMAQINT